ncbi:MAG TPA: PilZ domain-containing protein, partial [Polyangiaceae bacterium]|nr:PilZ domain-containing protein [Polyangiaceae bacterium]
RTHHRMPRRLLRQPCQVVRERDFKLIADRVVDLSATGVLVMPADPILTGERVILSFQLPNSLYWVDTEALVTRVVHGRRPGEHTRGVALELDGLTGLHRFMIERALKYMPPAPPRYRPGRRENAARLGELVGASLSA